MLIPKKVGRGPELICKVDVVISGGGTMNREAACLGVPVYSIYAGPLGSVDRHLMETGKLKLIKGIEGIHSIEFSKRIHNSLGDKTKIRDKCINSIIDSLLAAAK